MNREDIIRMAREAGWIIRDDLHYMDHKAMQDALVERIERFAALVAAAERHECAKIVDGNADGCNGITEQILRSNAAAIRARGQA